MKVILLEDIKGTGKAGDVAKVSDGYARNMLLPKGLAMEATDKNIRQLEKKKAAIAKKKAEDKEDAVNLKEKLSSIQVNIKTKAGEGGRTFGSITSKDIAEGLMKQHNISVDKKKIQLESPIKTTGEFSVGIKLYSEVIGTLKVVVAAE